MKITVIRETPADTWPREVKRFAKISFVAENREDGLELRKLYDEFHAAEYRGGDTYVDYDDYDKVEFGEASEVRKLTLIIGGEPKDTTLTAQQVVKGAYAFAKNVQG